MRILGFSLILFAIGCAENATPAVDGVTPADAIDAELLDADLYVAPGAIACDTPDDSSAITEALPLDPAVARPSPEPRAEIAAGGLPPSDPTLDQAPAYLLGPDGQARIVRK
jgi:hypothetical protein